MAFGAALLFAVRLFWLADKATVIRDISDGQYSNPVRVVAFNTAEGWTHDPFLRRAYSKLAHHWKKKPCEELTIDQTSTLSPRSLERLLFKVKTRAQMCRSKAVVAIIALIFRKLQNDTVDRADIQYSW